MRSRATGRFWSLFAALPPHIQRLADKNYRLWRVDPTHLSLCFRVLRGSGNMFTMRVGDHYRALGLRDGDDVTWIWIGTHADYDRQVRGA